MKHTKQEFTKEDKSAIREIDSDLHELIKQRTCAHPNIFWDFVDGLWHCTECDKVIKP